MIGFQNCSQLISSFENSSESDTGSPFQTKSSLLSDNTAFWVNFPGKDINEVKKALNPANITQWENTFNQTDVFKFYFVGLDPSHPNYIGADGVAALKEFIIFSRSKGKKVAFEVGGLYEAACEPPISTELPRPSQRGLDYEGAILSRFIGNGVMIDYLVIDGPMIRLFDSAFSNCVKNYGSRFSVEYAASELANYMQGMKNLIPDLKFYYLVNFPNWNFMSTPSINGVGQRITASDGRVIPFEVALNTAVNTVRQRGMNFVGLQIDNPYNFMIYNNGSATSGEVSQSTLAGRWTRLKNLIELIKNLQLIPSIIVNSETHEGPNPTMTQLQQASQEFSYLSALYVEKLVDQSALTPEIVLQSWYAVPQFILPESNENTFTNTFQKIRQILSGFNIDLTRVCSYTYSEWGSCSSNGSQIRSIISAAPVSCKGTPVTTQSCNYSAPVCTYNYSAWSVCQPNSSQTRSVLSSSPNNCQGSPLTAQSCNYVPPVCSYAYSEWSACNPNNTQSRSVISAAPSGCQGSPITVQSCTYAAPTCSYTYSSWLDCQSNNTQNRTVVSAVPSGCQGSPITVQSCTYAAPTCSYTYSNWLDCQSNNTQNRTVISVAPAGCVGAPELSQSCTFMAPNCNYTYSAWSGCGLDRVQNRTVLSALPAGCAGTPVVAQSCVPTLPPEVPIHRLFNAGSSDYLTTRISNEGLPYWSYVGIAFNLFSQPNNLQLVPLYRCLSEGSHSVSKNSNCDGTTQEGILGYMSAVETVTTRLTIYRCSTADFKTNLITINVSECTGLNQRAILGYTK